VIRFELRTLAPAALGMLADAIATRFWMLYGIIEQLAARK
jgi:hypothetical protein